MFSKDSRDNRGNQVFRMDEAQGVQEGGDLPYNLQIGERKSEPEGRNLNLRRSPGKDIFVFILHKQVVKSVNSLPLFATRFFPLFELEPALQLAKNLHPFKDTKKQIWRFCYFQKGFTACRKIYDFSLMCISTVIFLSPSKCYRNHCKIFLAQKEIRQS